VYSTILKTAATPTTTMAYTFGESPRTDSRKRDNDSHSNTNAIFSNSNSSSLEHYTKFNDGNSLTYSASSSQAEESTDSSVADIEFLKMIDKDQHIHLLEKASSQSFRRVNVNVSGKGASFRRENSVADSSLGYSTDGDWPYEDEHGNGYAGLGHGYGQQMFVSTKYGARRNSFSGQTSASQGHIGGNSKRIFAPANSTPKGNPKKGNSQNETSRYTPNQMKIWGGPDFSSPTMVSTDISTPSSGHGTAASGYASGSGYASAASTSTRSKTPTASNASTTPPRHVKRMLAQDYDGVEVWYQKWWMCGFTDALDLNST
jgi:hypothetical protein